MKYIDMHVHLFMEHTDAQIEKYVALKKQSEKLLKVVLIGPFPGERSHGRLFEVCRNFPDFFIPYPLVDLTQPEKINVQTLFDMGAVGLKFINPFKDYDDECFFPIYAQAEKLGMPILFHTGIAGASHHHIYPRGIRGVSSARMKPEFLDTIARAFPELFIHGAHLGNPWYQISLEIMRYNRNIYWDLSGTTLTKKMTAGWWARIQWEKESRKQFVYGTDEIPVLPDEGQPEHYTTGVEVHEQFLNRIGWSEEEKEGYFYKNALSILLAVYRKQERSLSV